MIALHISILDGNPVLWSEGKKIGMLKELRQAMNGIGMISPRSNTTKEFCVWLPCHGEKPLPSSPLIGSMPDIEGEESLRAFPITALRFNSTSLFELSLLSAKGNILGSSIILGSAILNFCQRYLGQGLFWMKRRTSKTLKPNNHVVHFDRWWNPAVENQATDRAFRIGQHKNKFITTGTLEERIDEMIEKKTTVAGQVLGTGEQWLTELSNNDLRNLIMLSQEATGE